MGSVTSVWPDLSWSTTLPFGKELIGDFDNNGTPDSESSTDYSSLNGDLSNGLIGYWSFNENLLGSVIPGGEDFSDLSGYNNHGVDTNGSVFGSKGFFNTGTSFNGIDDRIEFSVGTSLQVGFNSDFSYSFWVKIPPQQITTDTQTNRLLVWGAGGSVAMSFSVEIKLVG